MWGREIVMLGALLAVGACDDKNKLSQGFEPVGGKGNVYFVYLDERVYQGGKFDQMADGAKLCRKYHHEDACDVYIWTDKSKIPTDLPIMDRGKEVGWFSLRDGRPAYFKQANQDEPIYDLYDVRTTKPNHYPEKVKYYGGFITRRTQ